MATTRDEDEVCGCASEHRCFAMRTMEGPVKRWRCVAITTVCSILMHIVVGASALDLDAEDSSYYRTEPAIEIQVGRASDPSVHLTGEERIDVLSEPRLQVTFNLNDRIPLFDPKNMITLSVANPVFGNGGDYQTCFAALDHRYLDETLGGSCYLDTEESDDCIFCKGTQRTLCKNGTYTIRTPQEPGVYQIMLWLHRNSTLVPKCHNSTYGTHHLNTGGYTHNATYEFVVRGAVSFDLPRKKKFPHEISKSDYSKSYVDLAATSEVPRVDPLKKEAVRVMEGQGTTEYTVTLSSWPRAPVILHIHSLCYVTHEDEGYMATYRKHRCNGVAILDEWQNFSLPFRNRPTYVPPLDDDLPQISLEFEAIDNLLAEATVKCSIRHVILSADPDFSQASDVIARQILGRKNHKQMQSELSFSELDSFRSFRDFAFDTYLQYINGSNGTIEVIGQRERKNYTFRPNFTQSPPFGYRGVNILQSNHRPFNGIIPFQILDNDSSLMTLPTIRAFGKMVGGFLGVWLGWRFVLTFGVVIGNALIRDEIVNILPPGMVGVLKQIGTRRFFPDSLWVLLFHLQIMAMSARTRVAVDEANVYSPVMNSALRFVNLQVPGPWKLAEADLKQPCQMFGGTNLAHPSWIASWQLFQEEETGDDMIEFNVTANHQNGIAWASIGFSVDGTHEDRFTQSNIDVVTAYMVPMSNETQSVTTPAPTSPNANNASSIEPETDPFYIVDQRYQFHRLPKADIDDGGTNDLKNMFVEFGHNLTFGFSRKLNTGDAKHDVIFDENFLHVLWAFGTIDDASNTKAGRGAFQKTSNHPLGTFGWSARKVSFVHRCDAQHGGYLGYARSKVQRRIAPIVSNGEERLTDTNFSIDAGLGNFFWITITGMVFMSARYLFMRYQVDRLTKTVRLLPSAFDIYGNKITVREDGIVVDAEGDIIPIKRRSKEAVREIMQDLEYALKWRKVLLSIVIASYSGFVLSCCLLTQVSTRETSESSLNILHVVVVAFGWLLFLLVALPFLLLAFQLVRRNIKDRPSAREIKRGLRKAPNLHWHWVDPADTIDDLSKRGIEETEIPTAVLILLKVRGYWDWEHRKKPLFMNISPLFASYVGDSTRQSHYYTISILFRMTANAMVLGFLSFPEDRSYSGHLQLSILLILTGMQILFFNFAWPFMVGETNILEVWVLVSQFVIFSLQFWLLVPDESSMVLTLSKPVIETLMFVVFFASLFPFFWRDGWGSLKFLYWGTKRLNEIRKARKETKLDEDAAAEEARLAAEAEAARVAAIAEKAKTDPRVEKEMLIEMLEKKYNYKYVWKPSSAYTVKNDMKKISAITNKNIVIGNLKHIFDLIDDDASGEIDRTELLLAIKGDSEKGIEANPLVLAMFKGHAALRPLLDNSSQDWADKFKDLDSSGDGLIDFEEFKDFFLPYCNPDDALREQEEEEQMQREAAEKRAQSLFGRVASAKAKFVSTAKVAAEATEDLMFADPTIPSHIRKSQKAMKARMKMKEKEEAKRLKEEKRKEKLKAKGVVVEEEKEEKEIELTPRTKAKMVATKAAERLAEKERREREERHRRGEYSDDEEEVEEAANPLLPPPPIPDLPPPPSGGEEPPANNRPPPPIGRISRPPAPSQRYSLPNNASSAHWYSSGREREQWRGERDQQQYYGDQGYNQQSYHDQQSYYGYGQQGYSEQQGY